MDKNKIKDFYAHEGEANRLEQEAFLLEGIRTKEIIERYVQRDHMDILDIGGGAGYYSFWLLEKGHHVSLVDLSPVNIEMVRKRIQTSGTSLKQVKEGDAINLDFEEGQFDIVLLLGPLYHLTERNDRIKALSEARRVLRPGGVLLAAIITRYASLFDGFQRDLVMDDLFYKMLEQDLTTGVHLNESKNPEYFTTAFFHKPKEIIIEIEEAGLSFDKLIAIESFGWFVPNIKEKSRSQVYMQRLVEMIRMVECEEELMAMSPHIIAVAFNK